MNKTRKKFKQINCSATRKKRYTCYTNNQVNHIKKIWNKRYPSNMIRSNNPREIWLSLRKNMRDRCNNERCWFKTLLKHHKLDEELKYYTFAPMAPKSWSKNKNTWLTSDDIIRIMSQYERAYSMFDFIGPSPIDFDKLKYLNSCVWPELCNFEISSFIKKGKTKIGIVFNTDVHTESGSHWVAMFIDIRKKYIYYFDSTGDKPTNEVVELIKKIREQSRYLGIKLDVFTNNVVHQTGTTECGMYVLYFIIQLIKGEKRTIFNKRIKDIKMEELRTIYFN